MVCSTGDKVLIRLKENTIQIARSSDYNDLFRFEVIGERKGSWIIHIPNSKDIHGSFELSSWDCGKYEIDFRFLNDRAYIITEEHIVKVYKRPEMWDGLFCSRCEEFVQMAECEDGEFKCYLCRVWNKYR